MNDLESILQTVLQNYSNPPTNPNEVAGHSQQQVYNHYQQFAQQAPQNEIYQANHQYYQQLPQDQKQSLFSSIIGALTHHGVNPQQAGINPSQPNADNYAKALQYASQNPDMLSQIFGQGGALSSPLAKMALAGALAIAANRLQKGGL